MHSRLFWKILSDLKRRWLKLQEQAMRQAAAEPNGNRRP
jgi:hypothetical protein